MHRLMKALAASAIALTLTGLGCETTSGNNTSSQNAASYKHSAPAAGGTASNANGPAVEAKAPAADASARPAAKTVDPVVNPTAPAVATPAVENVAGQIKSTMAFPTGDPRTSAINLARSMPAEVVVGKPFSYTYSVTNLTSGQLDGVKVTESVPANVKLADAVNGAALRREGNSAIYDLGSVAPKETKTITVNATASAAGELPCCASVDYRSALCMTGVAVAPALKIEKTAPAEVLACDPIPVKIVVTNTGTGTVKGVSVTDTLPAGLLTADGKNTAKFDVGNLAAGQSQTVTLNLKADKTGEYVNKASAASADGLAAASNETRMVVRKPVLTITKKAPEKVFAGSGINYEITVTNVGDTVAAKTVVVDTLPRGVNAVSASEGGVVAPGKVTWNVGDLAPKASKTLTIAAKGTEQGEARNTATASATCAEAVSAAASTNVTGIPAILLEVVDDPDPIQLGSDTTYTITVTNQGSAPGTNIKIAAALDDGMTLVKAGGATAAKNDGKAVTFDAIATLAPKAKATFTVVVKAAGAGDKRFKVSMTSDQFTRPVSEDESSNFYE